MADDDNKLAYVDVVRPRKRYVSCIVDRGTGGGIAGSRALDGRHRHLAHEGGGQAAGDAEDHSQTAGSWPGGGQGWRGNPWGGGQGSNSPVSLKETTPQKPPRRGGADPA